MENEKKVSFNGIVNLWAYSLMLSGPGYFPFIRGYTFNFTGNVDVTLECLKEMLDGVELTGTLNECLISELQEKLYGPFSWFVDSEGVLAQATDKRLIQARVFLFLDIFRIVFNRKLIDRIFFYTPGDCDFFAKNTMWYFCFVILINEKMVLVYGKTWPNWSACKIENEIEERWRGRHKLL